MHIPSSSSFIESLFVDHDTDSSPESEPWQQPSSIPPAWRRFAHLNLNPFFTTHHYRFWHNINIYYHFRDTAWTVQQNFDRYCRDLQAVVSEMHFKTNMEHFAARKALQVKERFDLFQQTFEREERDTRQLAAEIDKNMRKIGVDIEKERIEQRCHLLCSLVERSMRERSAPY